MRAEFTEGVTLRLTIEEAEDLRNFLTETDEPSAAADDLYDELVELIGEEDIDDASIIEAGNEY